MSTKNTKLSVYIKESNNYLWYTFIRYKVIAYEEKLYTDTVSLLESDKRSILKELDSLKIQVEDLTVEELNENQNKLSNLNQDIINIGNLLNNAHKSFNKLSTDLYNTNTLDLLTKYLRIINKKDLNTEFNNYITDNLVDQSKKYLSEQKILDLLLLNFKTLNYTKPFNDLSTEILLSKKFPNILITFNKKFKKNKKRKKTIFKKIRFLKKFYKVNLLRKKKNYFFSRYFNFLQVFKKKLSIYNNILLKKIPLSERIVLKSNLEIFYKFNKHMYKNNKKGLRNSYLKEYSFKNKFKIYLRNFHQKPYWKLRAARIVHWSLFYNKTLRKQRYKTFINKFMKSYHKLSYNYFLFINFFYKTYISWTRLSKLNSFIKLLCIQKSKNILKLPIFLSNNINWSILKKKNFILKKKIGKWSYLSYKKFQQPWLQTKKNYPKYIKHAEPNSIKSLLNCSWDVITNTVYLNKEHHLFTFPTKDNFKINWQIKLHMYRYKSNNKCGLLLITC